MKQKNWLRINQTIEEFEKKYGIITTYVAVKNWMIIGYKVDGKVIKLKASKRFGKWYTRKCWVSEFVTAVSEGDWDE